LYHRSTHHRIHVSTIHCFAWSCECVDVAGDLATRHRRIRTLHQNRICIADHGNCRGRSASAALWMACRHFFRRSSKSVFDFNYLNAAIIIYTDYSPLQLLSLLKKIEADEGRTDQRKYASRTLDIDILFYDDLILNSNELIIPHPKLQERKFALVPLNEIAS